MLHIIGYTLGLLTLMVVLTQCRNANAECRSEALPDTSLVFFEPRSGEESGVVGARAGFCSGPAEGAVVFSGPAGSNPTQ